MEKLVFDTGIKEYEVNGGPDHGGGLLRINPSDPNLYARFLQAQSAMAEIGRDVAAREKAAKETQDGAAMLELLVDADRRMKALLQEVFGPENDFDAMLGHVNVMAVARNGERVITNMLTALEPILREGAEACAEAKAEEAAEQARAARAARQGMAQA